MKLKPQKLTAKNHILKIVHGYHTLIELAKEFVLFKTGNRHDHVKIDEDHFIIYEIDAVNDCCHPEYEWRVAGTLKEFTEWLEENP